MMITEIMKTIKCSQDTARKIINTYKIPCVVLTKNRKFYEVTPERLLEIRADFEKDPKKIAMQQAAALVALDAAFNRRQQIKHPARA